MRLDLQCGLLQTTGRWLVAALLMGAGPASPPPEPGKATPSYGCGTMALATLLTLEGHPLRPEQVAGTLPDRPHLALGELVAAARQHGQTLRGVRIDRRDWPLDRPALVHLNRREVGHFVVIRPVGTSGTLVQIIDPTRGVTIGEVDHLFAASE